MRIILTINITIAAHFSSVVGVKKGDAIMHAPLTDQNNRLLPIKFTSGLAEVENCLISTSIYLMLILYYLCSWRGQLGQLLPA